MIPSFTRRLTYYKVNCNFISLKFNLVSNREYGSSPFQFLNVVLLSSWSFFSHNYNRLKSDPFAIWTFLIITTSLAILERYTKFQYNIYKFIYDSYTFTDNNFTAWTQHKQNKVVDRPQLKALLDITWLQKAL